MPIAPFKKKEQPKENKVATVAENRKLNPDSMVLKKLKSMTKKKG